MNRAALLAMIAFMLLVGSASAQDLCSTLYPSSPTSNPATTYYGMFAIALVIILTVFVVLGLVYAIGYAFRIDKLTNYVKTEILESIANLVLIAIFSGGIGVAFAASVFFANVGMAGLQEASISGITSPTTVSSASAMYMQLCENYYSKLLSVFGTVVTLYASSWFLGLLTSFNIGLMPNGFGASFHPFIGLDPTTLFFYLLQNVAIGIIIIYLAIIMLTWLIFYLFPIFLYAGILFRSFPWTRAAGGTMLAIFISFYIILPAILYPFSFSKVPIPAQQSGSSLLLPPSIPGLPTGLASISDIEHFFSSLFSPNNAIEYFVPSLADAGIQLFGVIIALLISFDLIESFAELLGAPSLRGQSHKMLRRVI
ncbi:MAG: hypothetical protein QXM58_02480 [Candidatus Micrarchaeaceae archaeon]